MGFFDKIFSGLTKTRTNMEELEELFKNYKFESDDFYEELEDLLVMSDIGAETTDKVIEKMRLLCFDRNITKGYKAKECLMDAFYVRSNISPKDDMAHDADYIIDNFTNW